MGVAVPAAGGAHASEGRRRVRFAAGLGAAAGATAITAAVAATGAEHPAANAAGRAVVVAVPAAVGLLAWYRRRGERFGLLLIAMAASLFVSSLAESSDPGVYTLGRVSGWVSELLLVYLMLAFPTGRLPGAADRAIVGALAAVVAVAFVPRLVLAADFPVPNPYTSCVEDCPPNAAFALDREPALVGAVLQPLAAVLVLAVMVAVLVRLWSRFGSASPLARRMYLPVLAIVAARAALLGVAIFVRDVEPRAERLGVLAWLLALAAPALAIAFAAGPVRWRLFSADALERLAAGLRTMPDAGRLRRTLAEAFDDPQMAIVFPAAHGGGWVDERGQAVEPPAAGSGRALTPVSDGGAGIGAFFHDETLRLAPELLEAATAIASTSLDNRRLTEQTEAAVRDLSRSRARITAAAERERRRIERDLHDGAQQRLVALRIELQLAEELVRHDPVAGARRLHELEDDVDAAIDELRALAHGVYPPVLADRGLPDALGAAARRSPVPVEVEAHGVARYVPEVESAVYFCVLEALQNALKHARGARRIAIRLDGDRRGLRFSVRDDGAGMRDAPPGRGTANMHDRIGAVGGTLEIDSAPQVGTVVRGRVPAGAGAAA